MSDEATEAPRARGIGWLLFDEEHRLRALWRILFFLVVLVVIGLATAALVAGTGLGDRVPGGLGRQFLGRTTWLVVTALATALAVRVTEHRRFADVGFGLHAGWWREAVFGTAFGVALLCVAVLPTAAAGWLDGGFRAVTADLAVWFALWTIAAAFEELLMRGFIFQALVSGLGGIWATLITSALFAAMHLGNDHFDWIPALNTFAAGVLLGIAYLRTRSLWLATGVHVGWNFAMGSLLGLPVSGITFASADALLTAAEDGPDLATGGAYGPEGGLVALAAITLACAVLAKVPLPAKK